MRSSSSGPSASFICSHSPTVRPSAKLWSAEMLTAIDLGLRSLHEPREQPPLIHAPQFGLLRRRGGLLAAIGLVEPALRRAAERQPFDALLTAAVEEDVDRAAARRERRGRDEAPEHRILVVLAHRHHPHVDAVRAHHGRQVHLETLLEPRLLDRRLLPERAERPGGRVRAGLLRGAACGERREQHRGKDDTAVTAEPVAHGRILLSDHGATTEILAVAASAATKLIRSKRSGV